jgi:hypothetical protein
MSGDQVPCVLDACSAFEQAHQQVAHWRQQRKDKTNHCTLPQGRFSRQPTHSAPQQDQQGAEGCTGHHTADQPAQDLPGLRRGAIFRTPSQRPINKRHNRPATPQAAPSGSSRALPQSPVGNKSTAHPTQVEDASQVQGKAECCLTVAPFIIDEGSDGRQ